MTSQQKLKISGLLLVGLSLFATTALADIVSGPFITSHSSDVTVTQLSIARPAVTAGNLMLANIAINGGTSATVTAPTGWTQILRTDNDTNISLISYRKIVGASEPSSYTWSIDHQTTAEGGITVYSGVDTANPVDAYAGNSGFGLLATTTTVTTSTASSTIVTLFAIDVGKENTAGAYFSIPSSMTEEYDTSNTPFGPSTAQHEMIQAVAGSTGSKSSTISGNKSRNWVAQQIALRPIESVSIVENFESYSNGAALNDLNGGLGWTSAWVADSDFTIAGDVTHEGSKSLRFEHLATAQTLATRTFTPMVTGTLHWAQRKDSFDSAHNISLYSGSNPVMVVYQDAQAFGKNWIMVTGSGAEAIVLQPYSTNVFYTVDLQFDVNTQMYRVAIDGGPYSAWASFIQPASSVDTLRLQAGAAGGGSDLITGYWDDIRFTN